MSRSQNRVAAFVDALLKDRRPRRFPAEPEEAEAMHAAATLKSARPGSDLPSQGFVQQLERRLGQEAPGGGGGAARGLSRRRWLQAAGVSAAAAVAAGVAIDRLAPSAPARDGTVATGAEPGQDTLTLNNAQWVPVVAAATVGDGQAVRFSSGAVEGFVINAAGQFDALSAVCTHMGCILKFNPASKSLDCPCHGASFDLEGSPVKSEYLKSLPRIQSRVRDGTVEVQVNKA